MSIRRMVSHARKVALLFSVISCVTLIAQQPATPPTIEVTAREVQVPVWALKAGSYAEEVLDLAANDFHVDVGGKTQQLSQVRLRNIPLWEAHDDFGYHISEATSFGIWSLDDWRIPFQPYGHYYYISFIPSEVDVGTCYKIQLVVNRTDVKLDYPNEYCGGMSPADPLGDTKIDLRLRTELTSDRKGYILIASNEGIFLSKALNFAVQVTLELPVSAFRMIDKGDYVSAPVALLGRLIARDARKESRFSDVPFGSDYWIRDRHIRPISANEIFIGNSYKGYTRQFDLPSGDYMLKAVLDNGGNFGRIDMPVHVPTFDPAALWVSSVFLCRRFHQPTQDEMEKLPPQYTPLMSQGTEFEPAGDTRFTKEERLHLWFQIYAPPRKAPLSESVHYQIKLVNLQTGKVESETGVSGVHDFLDAGKPTIPIWKEVLINKLPPGAYRVDVQATDSVTGSTVQSSSTFTMVKKK